MSSTGRCRCALKPDVPDALRRFAALRCVVPRDLVAAARLRGSCTTTASDTDFGPFDDFLPVAVLVVFPGFRLRPDARLVRKLVGSGRLFGVFCPLMRDNYPTVNSRNPNGAS
jgi:hypothetical protein